MGQFLHYVHATAEDSQAALWRRDLASWHRYAVKSRIQTEKNAKYGKPLSNLETSSPWVACLHEGRKPPQCDRPHNSQRLRSPRARRHGLSGHTRSESGPVLGVPDRVQPDPPEALLLASRATGERQRKGPGLQRHFHDP